MQLPEHAAHAIRRLERAGFEAWAVGGCVRDSLRGVEPHDWDLCTSASPAQMQAVFADARVLTTGLRHGTLTVLTDGGPLEITTYRTESGYSDGRHPDGVRFVTDIREDLARRDFTVGAMAWHPERGLCDPFGGQTDLKNGVLRAVGDADTRFQEDALRILRGLRFASKLGFAIEPETAAAMRRQVHRLDCIAAERIREELTGLLCGRYVQRTLMAYADLITSALPELAPMQGCQQQNPHHLYDVWEHTVRAVGQVPAEPVLRWAMLLHDSGKPACKTVDEQGIGHFRGHPRRALRCRASSCRGCGSRARTPNAFSCWSSGTTHRSVTTKSWCGAACRASERRGSATCWRSKKAMRSVRAPAATMWRSCLIPKRC
ncbi:hypothetical protein DXB06_12980 [Butyricicoccus sp. OF13-6]|nr:hypothetical protein DXB06_12980 [Butyricicoccus sp. OF13-6]